MNEYINLSCIELEKILYNDFDENLLFYSQTRFKK